MKNLVLITIFILMLYSLSSQSVSASNISLSANVGQGSPYSWCAEHPFWNLCRGNDRSDPWDAITHDTLRKPSPQPTGPPPPSRLDICSNIVRTYNETHIYQRDSYDCDDMTLDIWNQLKKEYINAKIGLGNVTHKVDNLWESSHAWVIAEYEPDRWIALEGVDGRIINKSENPLYYYGWFFDSPQEYKKYQELGTRLMEELGELDRLHLKLNTSSLTTAEQTDLKSIIADHEKTRKELETKMIALSQGVRTSNLNLFENTT